MAGENSEDAEKGHDKDLPYVRLKFYSNKHYNVDRQAHHHKEGGDIPAVGYKQGQDGGEEQGGAEARRALDKRGGKHGEH